MGTLHLSTIWYTGARSHCGLSVCVEAFLREERGARSKEQGVQNSSDSTLPAPCPPARLREATSSVSQSVALVL